MHRSRRDLDAVETIDTKRSYGVAAFGFSVVGAFVILCGYYIFAHREDFLFVAQVSFPETAAAGLLILGSYVANSYQLHLFLRKFGLTLGFVELTALTMGMLLGNLVIPMRGGTGGLAVYLKRVHGLDFQAFAVIYAGTALLVALINAALAIFALVILGWFYGVVYPVLSLCVATIFVCCLYLGLF